jgi:hypothetical protein
LDTVEVRRLAGIIGYRDKIIKSLINRNVLMAEYLEEFASADAKRLTIFEARQRVKIAVITLLGDLCQADSKLGIFGTSIARW